MNCENIFPSVLLDLGFLQIHTYGVLALIGIISAFFAIKSLSKYSSEEIIDMIFYAVLGGILGARLFYVLIYNPEYYAENPSKIIAIWQGGLSVHGGIFGGALALLAYAKFAKKNFLVIGDLVLIGLALALFFGRIGNFVNGELLGRPSESFFSCDFGDGVQRFLYQPLDAIKNLSIFFLLYFLYAKKTFRPGIISALFLILIGAGRFLTEFVREPDVQIGFVFAGVSMGQILASLIIILGISLLVWVKKFTKNS